MEVEGPFFRVCPSCGSSNITLQTLIEGGKREYCSTCLFVANYVRFSCKPQEHCNPDVFAICPRTGCPNPGTPKKMLC
jgi:hypothetical protein